MRSNRTYQPCLKRWINHGFGICPPLVGAGGGKLIHGLFTLCQSYFTSGFFNRLLILLNNEKLYHSALVTLSEFSNKL